MLAHTIGMLQVFKGRRKCTGQITAMKFIVKAGKSEKDIKNLRQEIEILRQLKHENIIQMLDSFETKTDFVVVTGEPGCTAAEPQAGAFNDVPRYKNVQKSLTRPLNCRVWSRRAV